jgi:hypothetical protein
MEQKNIFLKTYRTIDAYYLEMKIRQTPIHATRVSILENSDVFWVKI